ncbi:MAG: GGDEF domain-containing protein [Candidatus Melainabacteria bacterium]|uniref:GGDEF domain-containing protein n=1 Tax=Candidatus Obscuribacter phosphatis TaxID=1906157 RepID=A0A8J7PH20_9BACT|nr:GGDEF domain-containing protein [Candidatus Obscuribacter phosphatis]MCA0313340.1 GGDEF domain-containing protein [Candidatus Melainabacteria bacterium]
MNYRTDEIDFSPFNADEVLKALCSVLRSSKHLSFGYAGDIQSLIDRIGRVFYAGRAMFFLAGKDDGKVEIFEYVKSGKQAVAPELTSLFGQKLSRHLMTLPQDVTLVEDANKFAEEVDDEYREMFLKVMTAVGKERVYLIPLKLRPSLSEADKDERLAGLLLLQEADTSNSVKWNKLVVDTLVTISDHLAKLFEVETLRGRLEAHESEDPTTGFLNRRGGVVAITEEVERARYFKDKISLLLIHVDGPKKGEPARSVGQEKSVLSAVSSVVSTMTRPVDVICRYGHEEFIVALPRMDGAEAVKMAQVIRSSMGIAMLNEHAAAQSQAMTIEPVKSPCSLSIGVATMPDDGTVFDELLSILNELVAEAKDMGGNQIKSRARSNN